MNLTEPSRNPTFTPPGWFNWVPIMVMSSLPGNGPKLLPVQPRRSRPACWGAAGDYIRLRRRTNRAPRTHPFWSQVAAVLRFGMHVSATFCRVAPMVSRGAPARRCA